MPSYSSANLGNQINSACPHCGGVTTEVKELDDIYYKVSWSPDEYHRFSRTFNIEEERDKFVNSLLDGKNEVKTWDVTIKYEEKGEKK